MRSIGSTPVPTSARYSAAFVRAVTRPTSGERAEPGIACTTVKGEAVHPTLSASDRHLQIKTAAVGVIAGRSDVADDFFGKSVERSSHGQPLFNPYPTVANNSERNFYSP